MLCKGKGPVCLSTFKLTSGKSVNVMNLYFERGYNHFLMTKSSLGNTLRCGDGVNEYGHLVSPILFFVGKPPAWSKITSGEYSNFHPVIVLEYRTHFTHKYPVNRGLYTGELSGKDLANWANFWEMIEVKRAAIKDQVKMVSAF